MSLPRLLRNSVAIVAAAALLTSGAVAVTGGGVAKAAVPAAPTGLLPNDPFTPRVPAHKDVVLTWTSVPDATSYNVQITADTNFTNPVLSVTAPSARYVPPVTLPHGDYRWRVRAVNADGRGAWSDPGNPADFTRGWEVKPDGLTYDGVRGLFSWTPIPAAASYDVEFSTRSDFSDLEQNKGGYLCRTNHPWFTNLALLASAEEDTECRSPAELEPSPSATPTATPTATPEPEPEPETARTPIPAGVYYWRVRGLDDSSAAPFDPEADSVNDAGCQGISYEALDTPAETSTAIPECSRWSNSGAGQVTVTDIVPGVNPASPAAPTTVQVTCPSRPVAPTPTCTNETPVITWAGVTGASSYKVSISPDRIFGNAGDYVYGTQLLAAAPRISLPDHLRYYVRVQACWATCGAASDELSFGKTSDAVVLISPTEAVVVAHPMLKWTNYLSTTGTLEAKAYRIQVGTTPDLDDSTPVLDITTDRAGENYGESFYEPTGLGDGTYYWRIQAIDASDRGLTWSQPRTFRADTTRSVASITTANGMPITGTVTVLFTEPVSGVAAASLQLIAAGATVATPGSVTPLSTTTYSVRPTSPLVSGQTYRLSVAPTIIDIAANPAVAGSRTVRTATTLSHGSPGIVETWDPDAATQAYGGSYAKSATRNATETLTLKGPLDATTVRLYGVQSPIGGWAHIYAGGSYRAPVSFYAPSVAWKRLMWTGSVPTLTAGQSYVVKVIVQGTRPVAARGSYVSVDQWSVGAAAYQEAFKDVADSRHSVVDAWSRQVASDAANGTKVVAMEAASAAAVGGQFATSTATVAGRSVAVKLCKSPAAGYADVTVDGVRRARVSLYQSFTSCGFTVYTGGLTAGVHRVGVGVTGQVPTGSRGSAVAVDMISVT